MHDTRRQRGLPDGGFAATGEAGLNYLCEGYKAFFQHMDRPMRIMGDLIRSGRYADEIVARDNRS